MLSPWTAHATSYPAVRKGIRQAVIAASDRRFLFDSGGDGPAGVEVHTVAYLTKPRRRGGGRRRSGGAAVFVDEPAEHIDPLDRPDRLHARGCVAHRCNGVLAEKGIHAARGAFDVRSDRRFGRARHPYPSSPVTTR